MKRGQGCWLWDHNENKYLDFICGLGASILGYAQTQVNQAVQDQLTQGAALSFSTHHEVELAEKMKGIFPFVDAWKFLKTGSEACSAAVRIARAATGRLRVGSVAYHGWHDGFVSLTPPATGVPPREGFEIELFDERAMNVGSDMAAIIIEPVVTDASDERRRWLQRLREECTRQGVMLIFDEVITGFRWPKFSVAGAWGINPDLIVLGKALGNGLPIAAVGGKYAAMNKDYFVSSTHAGECLSMVAAKKVIDLMLSPRFDLNWLWKQGQEWLEWFNGLYPEKIWIEGYPSRGAFKGDPLTIALFQQEACIAGMLFGPSWFLSFPAVEEAKLAKGAIKTIIDRISRGEVPLKGEMPVKPYAAKVRQ